MVSTKTAPTEFSFVDGSSISYGYVTISLSGNTVTVVNSDSYYTTTLNLIMTIMNPRFYISGFETDGTQISASCEFEDGMTWAEFCESDYNTIGVVNNNGTIYLRNNIVQSGSTSVNVLATDTIVENTSYYSGI